MSRGQCIGFGRREGMCLNPVCTEGRYESPLWCIDCEKARRDYLTKQFEKIDASFAAQASHQEGERG